MTKPKPKPVFSIEAISQKADEAHEFEIVGLGGEGTGMFLTVVGKESSVLKTALRKKFNEKRKLEFELEQANKVAQYRPIEDDIQAAIDTLVACTTGWRNVVIAESEGVLPFSPENVARLYAYDFVREQADKAVMLRSDFTPG